MLAKLEQKPDPNVLVGFEASDDAAVYKIRDDLLIIQTMDFFPPLVDNPYDYGRIAAANAISDIYAMGGTPLMALNILTFPSCLDLALVQEILRGGNEKALEAGINILGGHSIEDTEPKYGLSVVGVCHPDELLSNSTAQVGDLIVLTKAIGSGVLSTAAKANLIRAETESEVIETMAKLNRRGMELARKFKPSSATDVTGFGLVGHALEMAEASGVKLEFEAEAIPLLAQAEEMAEMGIIPAGAYQNKAYVGERFEAREGVKEALVDLVFDPQTSGGLLFSMSPENAAACLAEFERENEDFAIIGRVCEYTAGARIILK